jgi:uncharacterized protein (DUF2384 family)
VTFRRDEAKARRSRHLEKRALDVQVMHIISTRTIAMLSAFLDQVTDLRGGFISPQRLGEALHIPLAKIARLAKVHRNTLAQNPDSPLVQERLGEVARIITTATELLGGEQGRAIVWFKHQPLAGFDGCTAEELVTSGHGEAVLVHLDLLREGAYA